ncbi:MAG TPA: sialate O-acetylesterase, partial [Lacipirellulaceae bacterium]|nr:sialate O-acetylesterase [Lacipirellulaceae bacterium]
RLELQGIGQGRVVASSQTEPFGVGEVFLIAGQSYAAGENDALLAIEDPLGRVVCLDASNRSWRRADDPLPNVGEGGSIWPPMANALLPCIEVPIGLVNVAASGTASRQWLPGTPLFERLRGAGAAVAGFRMVLWQQGESDVIEDVATHEYVQNLVAIKEALDEQWNTESTWLIAKSTLHPTVYNAPVAEGRIRAAIDELSKRPGFFLGPDTDILGGENRGGLDSRRHFSEIGQRRAGLLWFASIWHFLQHGHE